MSPDDLRDRVRAAREGGFGRALSEDGFEYLRVSDDKCGLSRGTVLLGDRVVPWFPSIGRIFALEAGVRRHYDAPFFAEEKLNGYNVRIVRWQGRQVAFTRGGWVCPFTTDRLPDLAPLDGLFDEYPDAVVCAEVAGPDNPYINMRVPQVSEDVALFAFDLMRLDELAPRPLAERDEAFARHGVPRAPLLGEFSPGDVAPLREVLLRLDEAGSEGVVLKPPAAGPRVKYVTPSMNLTDILVDAELLAELPGSFFTGRIVRLILGLEELELRDRLPDVERRLGRWLLEGFDHALEQLRETSVVSHEFRVRVRDPRSIGRLLAHMNRHSHAVQVKELSRRREGDLWCAVFRKVYQQSTSYLKSLLGGDSLTD